MVAALSSTLGNPSRHAVARVYSSRWSRRIATNRVLRQSLKHENVTQEATKADSTCPPAGNVSQDSPSTATQLSLPSTLSQSFKERLSALSSKASTHFSTLGGKLNTVTGYDDIEMLKAKVASCDSAIREARVATAAAKTVYEAAAIRRLHSQKEVNDLLHRKSSWSDKDVMRFTELVREDHLYEQEEAKAKAEVVRLEGAVEESFDELTKAILNRYHEEQVWSDKIRSASTYGSLAALAVNLAVFILAIIVVEPWKRRKLAQTFEKRVEELSKETRLLVETSIQVLLAHIEHQEEALRILGQKKEESLESSMPETPLIEEFVEKASWLKTEQTTLLIGAGCAVAGAVTTVLLQYFAR